MITVNPARELGIDHRVGSIEVGKDADIALFNAHPFDTYARCQMALVDGEVRFLRARRPTASSPPVPARKIAMPGPEADASGRSRLEIVAESEAGVYAITGATVHPVSGPEIADGTVVSPTARSRRSARPDTPIPQRGRRRSTPRGWTCGPA